MPRARRDRSVSFDSSRRSPLPRSTSHAKQSSSSSSPEAGEYLTEWNEARCPVCIEHPHNAVLLICSSYGKGCRPYMCDSSYRHSNCFDQFCKLFAETPLELPQEATLHTADPSPIISLEPLVIESQEERNKDPALADNLPNMRKLNQKLLCPLCRGQILGCTVVESARGFMNEKIRNCACETCEFSGTYNNLRKHARQDHPLVRPSEADPERQRSWRRLERQRDIGDVLSTIQSSFGEDSNASTTILPFDDDQPLTVVIFLQFRSGSSSRSSSWSGSSRGAQIGIRRRSARLLGEIYNEETTSVPRDGVNSVEAVDARSLRIRRRSSTVVVENEEEQADTAASGEQEPDPSVGYTTIQMRRVRRRTTRDEPQ